MKRIISVLLALSLLCALPLSVPSAGAAEKADPRPDFSDVPEGEWYYDWVYTAADLGLVNGKGKDGGGRDIFSPGGSVTFAETVKLAACIRQLYMTGRVTLKNGNPKRN